MFPFRKPCLPCIRYPSMYQILTSRFLFVFHRKTKSIYKLTQHLLITNKNLDNEVSQELCLQTVYLNFWPFKIIEDKRIMQKYLKLNSKYPLSPAPTNQFLFPISFNNTLPSPLLAVRPWPFFSRLHFIIWKIGIIILTSQGCYED